MEKQKTVALKLSAVAQLSGGVLKGEDIIINGLSVPEDQKPGTICMIGVQAKADAVSGVAAAYIVADTVKIDTAKPVIIIKDTRTVLVGLLGALYPERPVVQKVSKLACIAESAVIAEPSEIGNFVTIGENSKIGANCKILHNSVIGDNVTIGENSIIYPNVTIYDNCVIGANVILHSGVVLGADGFGFIPGANPTKIPQKGRTVICDFVEIGANSCIDRGTIGDTIIGFGTKIDDLVMVGHNTTLGKACLVASQVGFSGSMEVGDFVVAGGQVGFSDHLKIASGAIFGGQSGVSNDVKEKGVYLGTPIMPMMSFAKSFAIFKELPELKKRLRNIEKQSD